MMSAPTNRRLKLPLSLIAAAAVIGAILQSLGPVRERTPDPDPRLRRPRWIETAVEPRPFPPGSHWEQGERLYGWNCMPCHGAEGRGDGPQAVRLGLRPRDYARGRFKLKTSVSGEVPFDEDLYRTISTGFPESAMPGFADFTAEERWSLVDHVKSLARLTLADGRSVAPFEAHPAKTAVDPAPTESGDPGRGARLFRDEVRCAQCHGPEGHGNGPAAATLVDEDERPSSMPDFARAGLSFKAGARAEDVYRVLTTGFAGSPMPSFPTLTSRDRWDLACFVAGQNRPAPPGEALFLALGCTPCHTIGKGKRVGPDLAGVGRRRTPDWLRGWLQDPPGMVLRDEQARALARDYPVPMPNLNLKETEIEALVEYLRSLPDGP